MAKKKEPDKLAQDAAAALAAGMSYGKWKAMQDAVKIEKLSNGEIPEGWKRCRYCGKPFKPKSNRTQYYCEVYCQTEAYKEKCREKDRERKRAYMAKKRAGENL